MLTILGDICLLLRLWLEEPKDKEKKDKDVRTRTVLVVASSKISKYVTKVTMQQMIPPTKCDFATTGE